MTDDVDDAGWLGRGCNAHFKSIKFIPNKFHLLCRSLHWVPQCIVNYSDLWPPEVLWQGSYDIPYSFSWGLFVAQIRPMIKGIIVYISTTRASSLASNGKPEKIFLLYPPPYFWRKPGMCRGAREVCSPDSHLPCPRNMPLRTCNTMIVSVSALVGSRGRGGGVFQRQDRKVLPHEQMVAITSKSKGQRLTTSS